MELRVGMLASSSDGSYGEIADVVVDPVSWQVTHLVVGPPRHHELARLVPIEAVASSDPSGVVFSWTTGQLDDAAIVQETDFASYDTWPHLDSGSDIGVTRVLAWPYYPYDGLGMVGFGFPYGYGWGRGWDGPGQATMTFDRVPEGTVEVRRSSEVVSSDGHVVGHVDGFLVDNGAKITHLVLDHGHLWGHRDVTIPIVDIERTNSDSVQLRVARDTIGEYPSVPFHRPDHVGAK